MNVSNVGKPSEVLVVFKYMKVLTLKRNPKNACSVEKHSLIVSSKFTNEFTLERNLMNVSIGVKHLYISVLFKCTKEFTLGRNFINASNVEKPL